MKLIKSKTANINYLSKIVKIDNFSSHPNPEYTKLKIAIVDGFKIAVSIDMKEGYYVYFPAMSQINPQLLSYLNLYSNSELNNDHNKKGFFDKNGRVKAIKLGGFPSEGFIMPFEQLNDWIKDSVAISLNINDIKPNTEFDTVEHNGKTFWVSRKYVVPTNIKDDKLTGQYRNNKLKRFDKLIDGQFKFHYDTVLIRKEPQAIQPTDLISITSKIHGTSAIFSYILCKQPRNKKETFIMRLYDLFRGRYNKYDTKDYYTKYDYIYSSRSVIKNKNINPTTGEGFYQVDVWKYAFDYIKPYLLKGMTIYAEIVGFLPNGQYIQKSYDYGCRAPRPSEEYKEGTHYKVFVYRITMTNEDGQSFEYSARQVQQQCKSVGLKPVNELYYGFAYDLYKDIEFDENWSTNFIEHLANDKDFFMEMNSPDCINKVPHEGIVIKKENMVPAAFKLKCFAFLNKEQQLLDKGTSNIEDEN